MKELNIKAWLESKAYDMQKEVIRKEINQFKIQIDRSCFIKTPEEKIKLFNLKKKWKHEQKIRDLQLKKLKDVSTNKHIPTAETIS